MSNAVNTVINDLVNCTLSDSATDKHGERDLFFSRSCSICLQEAPLQRSFFTGCGHVICRACAEQMTLTAFDNRSRPACPMCRQLSNAMPLLEDPEMDYSAFEKTSGKKRMGVLLDIIRRDEQNWIAQRELLTLRAARGAIKKDDYVEQFEFSLMEEVRARKECSITEVMREEARRVGAQLSRATEHFDVVAALGRSVGRFYFRREKQQLIEHLRVEYQDRPNRQLSRACGVCSTAAPRHHSIFTGCGHVICRNCAEMKASCPHCKKRSHTVNLYEDLMEKSEIKKNY